MWLADDLFAGAGGWDLAAQELGGDGRGIENMKEARATRDAAGLSTIHDDVWTFKPDGQAQGLIASPPCQTFSQAGKGAGRKALDDVLTLIPLVGDMTLEQLRVAGKAFGDDRTALVLTPLWFALHGNYRWLAWEQVPTVQPVWNACAEILSSHGWNVWTAPMYAERYGVPQTRKRSALIASLDHEVGEPMATHSRYYSRSPEKLDEGVVKWVSMAEALGWVDEGCMISNYGSGGDASNRGVRHLDEPAPTVTSKIDRNKVEWGQRRNAGPGAERRPRSVNEPSYTIRASGSGSHPCGVELLPEYLQGNQIPGGTTEYQRRSTTYPAQTITSNARLYKWVGPELPEWCHRRPSTTVVGSFKPEIIAAPGYRTDVSRQNAPDSVRVTVHEAGVLQSFPADYPWQGAKGKQFLQCGNAIPPGLALPILNVATGGGM